MNLTQKKEQHIGMGDATAAGATITIVEKGCESFRKFFTAAFYY